MLAMTRLPSDSFLPSGGVDSFDRSLASAPHLNIRPGSMISPLALPHSVKHTYSEPAHPIIPAMPRSQQYLSPGNRADSSITSPSMAPANPGVMSPLEHLSPQGNSALLEQKEKYIRKLQENWKADRALLEASRARAEEMFREERQMMDEERLFWVEQKTSLENEITTWKQRTEAAESKATRLTKLLESKNGRGYLNELANSVTASHELSGSATSTDSYQTPTDGVSPTSLPSGRGSTSPESNPFVPLDPRMQSTSPKDIAAQQKERVPSVDINEVIPGHEGVRLKAPAIQKSTFNDERPLSPTAVPPDGPPYPRVSIVESQSKVSHAVLTQEALLAPEHHRLTMHAGHTPSHSMSFSQLSTLSSAAGNTADSNGTTTPTSFHKPEVAPVGEAKNQNRQAAVEINDRPRGLYGEILYDPSDDDPALKGPLCLRNRPATDEVFLRRLSDKLEEVKATDATPAVLNEVVSLGSTQDPIGLEPSTCDKLSAVVGDPGDSFENVEEDIPLKLKKSNNFGEPLGQMRRTHRF